jgi:hypothetical protein
VCLPSIRISLSIERTAGSGSSLSSLQKPDAAWHAARRVRKASAGEALERIVARDHRQGLPMPEDLGEGRCSDHTNHSALLLPGALDASRLVRFAGESDSVTASPRTF